MRHQRVSMQRRDHMLAVTHHSRSVLRHVYDQWRSLTVQSAQHHSALLAGHAVRVLQRRVRFSLLAWRRVSVANRQQRSLMMDRTIAHLQGVTGPRLTKRLFLAWREHVRENRLISAYQQRAPTRSLRHAVRTWRAHAKQATRVQRRAVIATASRQLQLLSVTFAQWRALARARRMDTSQITGSEHASDGELLRSVLPGHSSAPANRRRFSTDAFRAAPRAVSSGRAHSARPDGALSSSGAAVTGIGAVPRPPMVGAASTGRGRDRYLNDDTDYTQPPGSRQAGRASASARVAASDAGMNLAQALQLHRQLGLQSAAAAAGPSQIARSARASHSRDNAAGAAGDYRWLNGPGPASARPAVSNFRSSQ